jgi:quinol monooxygenase YgiN
MIAFIATMKVKAGREAGFEAVCAELSEISQREEPDLLVYEVIRKSEDPSTYVFYARFRDQAAFDLHQEADYHQRLVPPILDCVEGEMDLQFFDWVS